MSKKQAAGISKEEFCKYLREVLIPDLKDSGSDFTADDLETALKFIDGADHVVRDWEK